MDEIPRLERPLLALDQQQALAGEDEKILLAGLAVVQPACLTTPEHANRESALGERRVVALEDAGGAEMLVRDPGRVPDVDHEPAVGHGLKTGVLRFEARLVDQATDQVSPECRSASRPPSPRCDTDCSSCSPIRSS